MLSSVLTSVFVAQMFDNVLLLAKGGVTAYSGPRSDILKTFEEGGAICPPNFKYRATTARCAFFAANIEAITQSRRLHSRRDFGRHSFQCRRRKDRTASRPLALSLERAAGIFSGFYDQQHV